MSKKITKPDAEWKDQLSDMAYKVTRKGKTEPAYSHDNFPKSMGWFNCVCCGATLFSGATKFDSGTGWPSFFEKASPEAVGEKADNSWFMKRTEVICTACDAHLGHVFSDGPAPTGLRYCINGAALAFEGEE